MMDPNVIDKECPIPEPFKENLGRILFLAALFFLTFIGRFIFAPLMPTLERELSISHAQAGSFFLTMSLGFFVGQICSGFLSSRIEHKGTLVISTLGVGIALLAFSLTSSISSNSLAFKFSIGTILFALGMASGLHVSSAIATITAMVHRQDWGKALAVHQTAPPLSVVLGPLLVILLLGLISWQNILAILGGISVVVGLAFIRFGRCGAFSGHAPRLADLKFVISRRSFWIMVILFAFAMGSSMGIYTMLPLFLVNERGYEADLANTLVGLSRISGLFMAFVAGWFTARLGEKRFIFAVMLTTGITTIMLGALSGKWLAATIFVQPAVVGCYFTAGFAALARIVQPNYRNVAASFMTATAFLIGGGFLPTAIGFMGETYSFGLGIVLIGCLTLVTSWLVVFLELIEKLEDGC
jgi:MFS transporter, NNP family, nitrate/nitrite transporter